MTRSGIGNQSALDFLERQTEELRKRISDSEALLTDYRSRFNLVSLEENQNIIGERLKAINEELTSLRMEQLQFQAQVEQIEDAQEAGSDLTEIAAVATYGSIPEILSRRKATVAEISASSLRYLEAHPTIVDLERRHAQIEKQLNEEVGRAVRDLNNRKETVDRRIANVSTELANSEREALLLDRQSVEYNVLKRQLDSDRQTFDTIIDRLNETRLSARLDTINLRILDEAVVPVKPVEPDPRKILAAASFLFLLGFVGLPILVELMDNRLKSAYDVETFIGKPLLADLPYLKSANEPCLKNGESGAESEEMFMEGLREAYSGLQLGSEAQMPKTLLVTSTNPSEGKSFVSTNLMNCMARHGLRCLLIDTDFRRPTLHRNFDLRNDKGIIQWYEKVTTEQLPLGRLDLASDPYLEIVSVGDGVDLLRSGGSTKKTTELIESEAFSRLMSATRSEYDVVLLDTPPVSVFADALFLSEFVDEIIYVSRFNEVSRQKVRYFINKLDGSHADVAGLIINGRNSSKGHRYGYDYTYSYYSSNYKYYRDYTKGAEAAKSLPRCRSRHSMTPTIGGPVAGSA